MSWFGGDLGQEGKKLTHNRPDKRGGRKEYRRGLELYYYSRSNKQQTVLLGIQDCGRGEWNRGGVELPKSDNGPESSSLVILCSFCLLPFCCVGPRDADAATAFFFPSCRYPPGQFTYNLANKSSTVQVHLFWLRQLSSGKRNAEVRGQRKVLLYKSEF